MKNLYSILFWGFAALLSACSEDLGNYDYTAPEIPVVTNLDSLYPVYVGDRLRIEPSVNFHDTTSLSYVVDSTTYGLVKHSKNPATNKEVYPSACRKSSIPP